MECRFVSLNFSSPVQEKDFVLSAWKVNYKYDEADTSFTSSDELLNKIWELSRYTLEAASLDTYTDSNTRERRPYEADGIIAATSRLLIQRDFLWGRHSHAWVINDPTWPVEWKQLSPFLGWQDYMATGQADLALAFREQMYDRTMVKYLDNATGVLKTSGMGRHIVDWMPDGHETDETVQRGGFTASEHMSVSNAFAAHGLELLAQMMTAGGDTENATKFASEAKNLKGAMMEKMWNGTAYCDGICADVHGKSLVMSNMFTLAFGMIPAEHVKSVWSTVSDWGLEQIGDYGAFWYQAALAGSYFGENVDSPDDGSAIYKALTKCDSDSWCTGLEQDNLTMTRESWHNGTYSHEWGTSPIVGVVWGLIGLQQTSPGFATYTVKPKLGGLKTASVIVPTLRGYIKIEASPGNLKVDVPCNTQATLCLPRSAHDTRLFTLQSTLLLLDGVEIGAAMIGGHLCTQTPVSCGKGDTTRHLHWGMRAY